MADWDGSERRNTGELTVLSAKLQSLHDDVSEMRSALKELTSAITKLALEYPNVNEQHTINRLYRSFSNMGGPLTCFNPIPSLAYHLSYAEPVAIKTDNLNWKALWDTV